MKCFFRLLLLASVPARAPTPDYPDRAGASIEVLPSSCPICLAIAGAADAQLDRAETDMRPRQDLTGDIDATRRADGIPALIALRMAKSTHS